MVFSSSVAAAAETTPRGYLLRYPASVLLLLDIARTSGRVAISPMYVRTLGRRVVIDSVFENIRRTALVSLRVTYEIIDLFAATRIALYDIVTKLFPYNEISSNDYYDGQ